MQRNETELEAERLVTLHQTIRESTQVVYDITEKLIDAYSDETRNPGIDYYVNFAHDELMYADKLIEMGRLLFSLKVYPTYKPEKNFWLNLEKRSDEQRTRLDHHLRFVCLRDSGDLLPRRDAAEAVIDGMLEIYKARDWLFYILDRDRRTHELSSSDVRLLDGVIESSIDFVEAIAGVVRRSTQVAPL